MNDTAIVLEAGGTYLRLMPRFDRAGPIHADSMVEALIEADSGTFRGSFRAFLCSSDLDSMRAILSDLYQNVGDTTERFFATLDGEVQLTFRPSHLGGLEVEVAVAPSVADGPFLRFFMEADQSYLPGWIASLDAVIEEQTELQQK